MARLDLVLCVHSHQPVGQLEPVFEAGYRRAYGPFLDLLERHPRVRCALHASGVLLDWLAARHAGHLDRLGALVRRGQVELLTGGHYEPILAALPEADRVGQVRRLSDTLERLGGRRPSSLWLAEQAWEPHLPPALRAAGVAAVVVPDALFAAAGLGPGPRAGYWLTEDLGQVVAFLPALDWLDGAAERGEEPSALLERLRGAGGARGEEEGPGVVVLAVAGERLVAPEREGEAAAHGEAPPWPERLFEALEGAAAWADLVTPAEHLARARPAGRAYFGAPAAASWRLALARSATSNALHKKMLRVSRKVEAAARHDAARGGEARAALFRGQCHDAYRAGAGGGALPHLRSVAYRNLVTAERIADAVLAGRRPGPLSAYPWGGEVRGLCTIETGDFDADGALEVAIDSAAAALLLAPAAGGGLAEFDVRAKAFNLLDTGRPAFLDHFLGPEADLERVAAGACEERGRFFGARYDWTILEPPPVAESEIPSDPEPEPPRVRLTRRGPVRGDGGSAIPVTVAKTVRHDGDRAAVSVAYLVQNDGHSRLDTTFGVEVAVNLLAPRAPDRYVRIPGVDLAPEARYLGSRGATPAVTAVEVVDEWLPLTARLEWDEPADLWRFPLGLEGPPRAGAGPGEAGETAYRGSVLLLRWPVGLEPGDRFRVAITLTVV